MKPAIIQNFKLGLDTRRSVLTSQAGTLVTLNNAHVNEGAEIAQRKAFVKLGKLPTGCFDIVALPAGLVTFGSTASGSIALPAGLTAAPANLTYQRLQHYVMTTAPSQYVSDVSPIYANVGGTVAPAMDGVNYGISFGGKALVSAHFTAGAYQVIPVNNLGTIPATSQLFYDGVLVQPNVSGEDMFTGTQSGLWFETGMWNAFPATFDSASGFSATVLGGGVGAGTLRVTGPPGQAFTIGVKTTGNTTPPGVSINNATTAAGPIVAVSASATFYLVSGTSGSLSALTVPDGTGGAGTVSPISGAVAYAGTLLKTAQALVDNINNNTGISGYSATAQLVAQFKNIVQLTITAPAAFGTNANTAGAVPNFTLTSTGTIHLAATPVVAGAVGALGVPGLGGVDAKGATSQVTDVLFDIQINTGPTPWTSDWAAGSTLQIILTSNNISYTLGHGNIGGIVPTFMLALANKAYLAAGTTFYFSKINDATKWEQQDTGAGDVGVFDQYSAPTDVVGMAPYQGGLAVFERRNIQIWTVNADPTLYTQRQNFQNIGSVNGLCIKALGDLDVIFPSDSGFRSLRVRDSSNNAYVSDLGSPVDSLFIADLLSVGPSGMCGEVEPTYNRYWAYINNKIYVLSLFPSLKISAWSTYDTKIWANITFQFISGPDGGATFVINTKVGLQTITISWVGGDTDGHLTAAQLVTLINGQPTWGYTATQPGGLNVVILTPDAGFVGRLVSTTLTTGISANATNIFTSFTPKKFVVYNGQVFVLDTSNNVYVYGGLDNNTYDGCVVTVETPWLDNRQMPLMKQGLGIDFVWKGLWTISAGTDPKSGTLEVITTTGSATASSTVGDSSFDVGTLSYYSRGTHYKMKAVSDNGNLSQVSLNALVMLSDMEYFQ